MSCAKNNNIQITDEFGNIINSVIYNRRKRITLNCRSYKSVYPSFAPTINSLSVTSSIPGTYSNVIINGSNFLPPCYGTTYVNFGSFKNLPILFYSNSTISFIVPLNAPSGSYNVQVVNIYNGNFSPSVNQSYPGIPNFSNSVTYTINSLLYSLTGTYSITSDSNYNTIITFTDNGSFTILNEYSNIPINYIVVGGGAGGGGGNIGASPGAGGGGGGGVSTGIFDSSITTYTITVGAGGQGGNLQISSPPTSSPSTDGANGSSSQISGVVTVSGGLGGKASSNGGAGGNSGNGGAGGTGNTFPGGNGTNGGGGGGGAYSSGIGGNGSISSTSVYSYGTSFGAGGGGGGGNGIGGTSGNTYAGNGGTTVNSNGLSATANYGGGGGGGRSGNGVTGTYGNGGNGGSGRVILYFNN